MKKSMKWIVTVILILIVLTGVTLAAALPGLKQTAAMDIEAVDLTQIPDGSYTGSYNSYRWSTTVEVTLKDHRITDILSVKIQSGRDDLYQRHPRAGGQRRYSGGAAGGRAGNRRGAGGGEPSVRHCRWAAGGGAGRDPAARCAADGA